MPQRRKGRTNNKKKKNGGRFHQSSGAPPSRGPPVGNGGGISGRGRGSGGSDGDSRSAMLDHSATPDFSDYSSNTGRIHQAYPTVFARYKTATQRFWDYMILQLPPEDRPTNYSAKNSTKVSVDYLTKAADYMEEQHQTVDQSALKDLKLTIRIRRRVATSVFGGGDAGHKYFLSVLAYCWSVLRTLPTSTKGHRGRRDQVKEEVDIDRDGTSESQNRFNLLIDDENDIDDMEDDIEDGLEDDQKPRPKRPVQGDEPLTLNDLMNAEDRYDASLFLLELNEMMSRVVESCRAMLRCRQENQRLGVPESAMVEDMIETGVTANAAIQRVQQLEMDFQVQHPHLNTPYQLLSLLVFPQITQAATAAAKEYGNKPCSEKNVGTFLGKVLEMSFRNKSDPKNELEQIVQDFVTTYEIDHAGVRELEKLTKGIQIMTTLEVPIGDEQKSRSIFTSSGVPFPNDLGHSHQWIQNMEWIGNDRAIHHTLRLLQTIGHIIKSTPHDKNFEAKRGFFTQSIHRKQGSSKIHNDMDEILAAEIIPKWVLMCRHGILSKAKNPRESELYPIFLVIQSYVQNPDHPVSWAVTFTFHAILTSILEMKPAAHELTRMCKTTFNNLFENFDWATQLIHHERTLTSKRVFVHNMVNLSYLENFGLPVWSDNMMWNPLCAGTLFSYFAFFGNLEIGCTLVDCHGQLRIVLHLYNALLVTGILQPGQIQLLDILMESFASSRAIWEGPLPKRGEFVQRFWACWGMNRTDAKEIAKEAKRFVQGDIPNSASDAGGKTRKLNPIEPAEISKSFRRVCNRDFVGVEDKYHTEEQRRRTKGTEAYRFAVCTNDTLDAIDSEQALLALNLPVCGVLLEQFVCSLTRCLLWDSTIESVMNRSIGLTDKRAGFVALFTQNLLGALDFAEDPADFQFQQVPLGRASAAFMSMFFENLDPSRLMWFTPVREIAED